MFAKTTAASEKVAEGVVEVNASAFKGAEVVAKKAYDNYVANVSSAFDSAKTLAKTTDVADFYKAAATSFTKASETYTAQGKELAELSTKVYNENVEVAKKLYTEAFKTA